MCIDDMTDNSEKSLQSMCIKILHNGEKYVSFMLW